MFSYHFNKGGQFCDFLFAPVDNVALLKWNLPLKERICSFFLKEHIPHLEGRQKEIKRKKERKKITESYIDIVSIHL